MKKLKKISKIILISFSIIFAILTLSCVGFYHAVTHGVSLDKNKIKETKSAYGLKVYDINHEQINPSSNLYIPINKLKSHTKNAFISAEDKRFYSHNGIDYIRIGGAIVSNLKSKSFSEGASTISQQLIKNILLSNEKTINRKLKEFKLARELEKNFSKDEILELYLNNIYFGNGAYGIENASFHYFGKSSSDLTLAESALLAGTINAPSFYNIQKNTEKSIERRNLILKLMNSQGNITNDELTSALNEPINLNITNTSNNNYIFNEIIEEACQILNKTENELKNTNMEIFTNYNLKLKNSINDSILNNFPEIQKHNIASIVINNKTNLIEAVLGNSKTLNLKKQPGSTIKPILVYAPAIEKGIVSPAAKILDEEINIGGYSPENADHKYHGYVSVRECLKNSYNIPAVKLLNEVGIENSQDFAKQMNIQFLKSDNNLAIALGGFTEGTTLKELADAYSTFANQGNFSESKYISKIKLKNKTLYSKQNNTKKVMSDSTAYLVTDMLIDTSKSGTAKKLSNLPYEVASKTGTVGKQNSNNNTDAFCISYTTTHTIISYVGDDSMNENITGSTYPTLINKSILNYLYKNKSPDKFLVPDSIVVKNLNKEDYNNNFVIENQTNNDSIEETFATNNPPPKPKLTINLNLEAFNFENRKPILSFFATNNYIYHIKRVHKKTEENLSSISIDSESKIIKYEDISAKSNEIYEYFIEICEKSSNKKFYTNKIKLKSF